MEEHFQLLIQKYFAGKLSLKELIDFSDLLADKKNSYAEHLLSDDWNLHLETEVISNCNLKHILDQVHHRIRLNEYNKYKRPGWGQIFQRVAAILIVPLLILFVSNIYRSGRSASTVSYAEIQCPLGVRTKFMLPDGSTGFMNSGSRLKYPVVFDQQRIVELSGEAFFEVVPDKNIPFHIITPNLDLKVVGTTFNVIANENEKTEEIVLQTGRVDVLSKDGKQLAVLSPNDQLTLNTEKQTFSKRTVIASQYTAWREGKLVFRNENMQQVARRLSRWYNADVFVKDRLLEDYTFHATFIDEPLDEVLKLISMTTPIIYKEERRIVSKDGIYQKRKIFLYVNKLNSNQFR